MSRSNISSLLGSERGARLRAICGAPISDSSPSTGRLCRNSKTRRTVENCKHISVENNDVIPTFASSDIQSGIASCSFPSVALLRHSLRWEGIDVRVSAYPKVTNPEKHCKIPAPQKNV